MNRAQTSSALFRAIIGSTLVLALFHIGWLWIAHVTISVDPAIIWLMDSAVVMAACLSSVAGSFLAFGRHRVYRDQTSYWMGEGFACLFVSMVLRMMSVPLRPGGAGVLGHSPSAWAWIGTFGAAVFGLCIAAAFRTGNPSRSVRRRRRRSELLRWPVCVVVVCAVLLAFDSYLPVLVSPDGRFVPLLRLLQLLTVAILACGAILATRRYVFSRQVLAGYVAIGTVGIAFAIFGNAAAANRFSLLTVIDRAVVVAAYWLMLLGLLSDYVQLLTRERDRTFEAQARSAEVQAILHSIPDAVFVFDLDGRIRIASRTALELLHSDGGDDLGERLSEWAMRCETRDRDGRVLSSEELHVWRAARGEVFEDEEVEVREPGRKDGRCLLMSAGPVTDDAGAVVGRLLVATEITNRKEREVQIEELNQVLNAQVVELRRTETALRRSNDDLQQFAYVASHDLREPLRNISTHAGLLARAYRNGRLDQYGETCIGVITDGTLRMESLIKGLLTYARSSMDSIEFETVDMKQVLEDTLNNCQCALTDAQAAVTHDDLPVVRANQMQITQVLQNLIGNAVQYRRSGTSLQIHVGAEKCDQHWTFCVRDNGEGFRSEYSQQIFGIFKRLHGSENPGTGIGLAVCKAVIDRHGGKIWAEGRPDAGATIYFTLPKVS
ncbi:MAG: PAS domain-containing protein [Acidobacteriaceae bacterium]|nr:PAS domain-containing protein [Acidobacteriaceae bacterium]